MRQALERAGLKAADDAWKALDWLTAPQRQLVRVITAAPERPNPRSVHYPIQSFFRTSSLGCDKPAPGGATNFYQEEIGDPDWNFDWGETTVSHSFRFPTAGLDGRTYGQRFAEAIMRRWPPQRIDREFSVLEMTLGAASDTDPLYQIGGPRSVQLAMKLQF